MTGEASSLEPADGTAARVLIVDDDAVVRDAIGMVLSDEGYDCRTTSGAESALEMVRETDPHLVISDMKMPGKDGLWLLDRLRRERPDTAVVMLTAYGDTEAAVECLRRGATDYLLKPPKVDRPAPRHRARPLPAPGRAGPRALPDEPRADGPREGRPTCGTRSSRSRPPTTAPSTRWWPRSTPGSTRPATTPSGWGATRWPSPTAWASPWSERHDIFRGALLHDIGKIGVPDAILLKPGPLDPAEWEEMRKHPQTGFNILKSIGFLRVPAEIVLSHQERFDGSGYPRGLRRRPITVGARIFAVADTLDAMASDRPYRRSLRLRAGPSRRSPASRGPSSTPGSSRRSSPSARPASRPSPAWRHAPCDRRRPDPGLAAHPLVDPQGRHIVYLRLSLTDRCNFRCSYCSPRAGERHGDAARPARASVAWPGSSPRWASGASGSPAASPRCAGTSWRSSPTSHATPGDRGGRAHHQRPPARGAGRAAARRPASGSSTSRSTPSTRSGLASSPAAPPRWSASTAASPPPRRPATPPSR